VLDFLVAKLETRESQACWLYQSLKRRGPDPGRGARAKGVAELDRSALVRSFCVRAANPAVCTEGSMMFPYAVNPGGRAIFSAIVG